ncbi:MAG: tetratricopeptide repeat protein [Rickettsiales bacterium]
MSSNPKISTQADTQAAQLINQAIALNHQQQYQQSLEYFNQAIALKPDMALAYFNRGVLFKNISRRDAMVADFGRALQLDPNNFDICYNVAAFLMQERLYVEALKVAQRAVELKPDNADAWFLLPTVHYQMGNTESVQKLLAHLVQKFPENKRIRIADALFLPPIPMSNEDIDQSRARFLDKIERLMAEKIWIENPLSEHQNSLFYLAYHGRDNKEINQKIAEYFLKSCPALAFEAPHCSKPRKPSGKKIRLGFVSPSMHKDTLNQFLLKIIEKMSEHCEFDIVVFSNAPAQHPEVQKLKRELPHYVDLPMDLHKAQQAIAKEEMDILFYMEVGSDQLMYALPFARLAHMQCVWGGVPITTGIPNMDYFISNQDGEVENAQEHYTEKLILLDRTLAVYSPPNIPDEHPPREALGLPAGDVRLYSCPVLLHKLHPDMDTVFKVILERDPKARIVLFDPKKTLAQAILTQRFAKTMSADLCKRIVFVPFAQKADFPVVLRTVDCVLDTFHYSFGTTAYICFSAGVPFVTLPNDYYASRAGHRMYTRMDMPEMIASTPEEYAEIAIKLAQDKNFYNETKEKIIQRRDQFFDDYEIVDEFAERMKQLYFDDK